MRLSAASRNSLRLALLSIFGAIAVTFALSSEARPVASGELACESHAEITKQLGKRFQESPSAIGLSSTGAVIEIFTGSGDATWTIVVTTPDGNSCVIATGEAWEAVPAKPNGRPA